MTVLQYRRIELFINEHNVQQRCLTVSNNSSTMGNNSCHNKTIENRLSFFCQMYTC